MTMDAPTPKPDEALRGTMEDETPAPPTTLEEFRKRKEAEFAAAGKSLDRDDNIQLRFLDGWITLSPQVTADTFDEMIRRVATEYFPGEEDLVVKLVKKHIDPEKKSEHTPITEELHTYPELSSLSAFMDYVELLPDGSNAIRDADVIIKILNAYIKRGVPLTSENKPDPQETAQVLTKLRADLSSEIFDAGLLEAAIRVFKSFVETDYANAIQASLEKEGSLKQDYAIKIKKSLESDSTREKYFQKELQKRPDILERSPGAEFAYEFYTRKEKAIRDDEYITEPFRGKVIKFEDKLSQLTMIQEILHSDTPIEQKILNLESLIQNGENRKIIFSPSPETRVKYTPRELLQIIADMRDGVETFSNTVNFLTLRKMKQLVDIGWSETDLRRYVNDYLNSLTPQNKP